MANSIRYSRYRDTKDGLVHLLLKRTGDPARTWLKACVGMWVSIALYEPNSSPLTCLRCVDEDSYAS